MYEDQTPPNGDFAAYIEARTRTGAGAALAARAAATATAATATATTATATSGGSLTSPATGGPAASSPAPGQALGPLLATLRQEFAPFLRMIVIALLLLWFANAFAAPLSSALRFGAVILILIAIKRGLRRTATIQALLKEMAERARAEARRP